VIQLLILVEGKRANIDSTLEVGARQKALMPRFDAGGAMTREVHTVRFVVEIDIDSYVRAGVSDFAGRPHLFISECLDYDHSENGLPESFFLVPVSDFEVTAFEKEYHRLASVQRSQQRITQRWALWCQFRHRQLASAHEATRAERNFFDVWIAEGTGRRGEVVDSGWVVRGVVPGDQMRRRLCRVAQWEQSQFEVATHPEDDSPTRK
jgi:hypothetical protein